MTRTRTWIRTTERSGSSTRAWTCRAAVAAEIARVVRFWPRLWQRHRCGSRQPVAVMPLNGVDQELPTLNPATPRAAPLEGGYWGGRWTTGRASARCRTRKSARWTENLRGVVSGRRRGRRPGSLRWGDLELCCWGRRGDMHAPMMSKFQLPNYRPPGVRRAFAICGLEKKLRLWARGRCGGPPHFLAGFLGSAGPGTPQRAPNRRESPGGGAGGLGWGVGLLART